MKPADQIDLTKLVDPAKDTVTGAIREVVRRMYKQNFTARQVYLVLLTDPKWADHAGLYATVRKTLLLWATAGTLVIATRGRRGGCTGAGNGSSPHVYRNKESKDVKSDP